MGECMWRSTHPRQVTITKRKFRCFFFYLNPVKYFDFLPFVQKNPRHSPIFCSFVRTLTSLTLFSPDCRGLDFPTLWVDPGRETSSFALLQKNMWHGGGSQHCSACRMNLWGMVHSGYLCRNLLWKRQARHIRLLVHPTTDTHCSGFITVSVR